MKAVKQMAVVLVWCVVSVGCVAEAVKQSSGTSEAKEKHYQLIYSENEALCGYVDKTINEKLKINGTIKIDVTGGDIIEKYNKSIFGFPQWRMSAPTETYQLRFPYANFDINNDGKDETILLAQYGNSWQTTAAYIVPYDSVSNTKSVADEGTHNWKPANSIGSVNIDQYHYQLRKLDEKPKDGTGDWLIDKEFTVKGLQDIQFFKYKNKVYFTLTNTDMAPKYKSSRDGKTRLPLREFLIVGEYLGGDLDGASQNQDEVIKSSCYFELINKQK